MSLVSPTNQIGMTNNASISPNDETNGRLSEFEKMRRRGFWFRKWSLVDMATLCWLVGIHVLAASALFVFDWGAFIVGSGLAFWTGIGITLGYHRLLTHQSFKTCKWIEYFFAYCGLHACQKDPISWVSVHKNHHKFTETDRDPHSPNEGFWFSHMGWLCYKDYIVAKCGESSNVPELKVQPFYRFLHNTYLWHPSALAALLYHYGGFPYLAWGMGVRTVVVCQTAFVIQSIGHTWGERTWNTRDTSTNNWWIGMFGLGEGWHNNHHAFPNSARHGLEWWQFDFTWELIKFFELVGLATDIKLPTEGEKMRMKTLLGAPTKPKK